MMTAERSLGVNDAAAELGRWSVGTAVALLATAAVLVGWRRLAGALVSPLEPAALLGVGALVAVAAAGVRTVWHYIPGECKPVRLGWLVLVVPLVSVAALGAALTMPGTAGGGLIAFWVCLFVEESWAWRPVVWRTQRGKGEGGRGIGPLTPHPSLLTPHSSPLTPHPSPLAEDVLPDDVLQQLTRSRAADGTEQVQGWLRMRFASGQRTAIVHVAFCPPFEKTPELAVEQLDGPPMRIKTAQLLPYGVRLDLKLGTAAEEPLEVLLQLRVQGSGFRVQGSGF